MLVIVVIVAIGIAVLVRNILDIQAVVALAQDRFVLDLSGTENLESIMSANDWVLGSIRVL